MAALSTQNVTAAGAAALTPSYAAASAGGDTFWPGDKTFLVVKNGGGSPITVTLASYPDTAPWGTTIPDLTVTVPASGERWYGPLVGSQFANPANGQGSISYSATTSVTVGVFSI